MIINWRGSNTFSNIYGLSTHITEQYPGVSLLTNFDITTNIYTVALSSEDIIDDHLYQLTNQLLKEDDYIEVSEVAEKFTENNWV